MPDAFISQYLTDAVRQFRNLKTLAEGAMAQIDPKDLYTVLDEEANSIAVVLKHMSGSMRSRWADFPATAEDTGTRNRDSEFMIADEDSHEVLLERWEAGWRYLFDALERLTPENMATTLHIRGKPVSAIEAINRQLTHYAYHVGQIVFLAKHWRSGAWRSLSIPRGESEKFTTGVRKTRDV
jgi:Protein of unknown function (DUF1572)